MHEVVVSTSKSSALFSGRTVSRPRALDCGLEDFIFRRKHFLNSASTRCSLRATLPLGGEL